MSNQVTAISSSLDNFNLSTNDTFDFTLKHASSPSASSNNMATGIYSTSTNVLFRHVPTAATLLRNTMYRSRASTNTSSMTNSPIHMPSPMKKPNLRSLSKVMNNNNGFGSTQSHDEEEDFGTFSIF